MNDFVRAFIREGDTTTVGGTVMGGVTLNVTMHGKLATYAGDPVHCPACKSTGLTECVQPYLPHTGPDGRQRSLDGDLCRCACSPPPRLKALEQNYTMTFDKAYLARQHGSEGWLAYAGHGTALTRFDEFFVVHDRATGKPFARYAYGIRTAAGVHEDHLYVNGATAKGYAEEEKQVELIYLIQTSIGVRE